MPSCATRLALADVSRSQRSATPRCLTRSTVCCQCRPIPAISHATLRILRGWVHAARTPTTSSETHSTSRCQPPVHPHTKHPPSQATTWRPFRPRSTCHPRRLLRAPPGRPLATKTWRRWLGRFFGATSPGVSRTSQRTAGTLWRTTFTLRRPSIAARACSAGPRSTLRRVCCTRPARSFRLRGSTPRSSASVSMTTTTSRTAPGLLLPCRTPCRRHSPARRMQAACLLSRPSASHPSAAPLLFSRLCSLLVTKRQAATFRLDVYQALQCCFTRSRCCLYFRGTELYQRCTALVDSCYSCIGHSVVCCVCY